MGVIIINNAVGWLLQCALCNNTNTAMGIILKARCFDAVAFTIVFLSCDLPC